MDIELDLYEIIERYDLYSNNFRLKQYAKIVNLLKELFRGFSETDIIALRGGGKNALEIVSLAGMPKIKYVIDKDAEGAAHTFGKGIDIIKPQEISGYRLDVVIVTSSIYQDEMVDEVLLQNTQVKIINFCDWLERNGVVIEQDFHHYKNVSYSEIYHCKKCLERHGQNEVEKKYYLKQLIGYYIGIRDFKSALFYINTLKKFDSHNMDQYENCERDINNLMARIKRGLKDRECIIINWLDGLRNDEVKNMPWLYQKSQTATVYSNAYTAIPYTRATLKTILTGKTFLENSLFKLNHFTKDNCRFLMVMKDEGYRFSYIGMDKLEKCFDAEYRVDSGNYDSYCFSTIHQWRAVRFLIGTDSEKNCLILHSVGETHAPFFSAGNMTHKVNEELGLFENYVRILREKSQPDYDILHEHILEAQQYLDEQLQWYDSLYGSNKVNIYMSDHAQYRNEKYMCDRECREHTVLIASGSKIRAGIYNEIFSYTDFYKLIKSIIRQEEWHSDRTYAVIQGEDVYDLGQAQRFINQSDNEDMWHTSVQYQGVITRDEKYLRYNTGTEFYMVSGCGENMIDSPRYQKRINEIRKICGSFYIDIFNEPYYKISSQTYKILGIHPKKDGIADVCDKYKSYYHSLSRWICNKNEGKEIDAYLVEKGYKKAAIYGAGPAGIALYEELKHSKIDIVCFIDNNRNINQIDIDGIPIIHQDGLNPALIIDVVIVTPFFYFKDIYRELCKFGYKGKVLSLEDIVYTL